MPVLSLRPQLGAAPPVEQALPFVFVELDLGNLVSGAILDDPLTAQLEGVVVPPFAPTDVTGLVAWYDFSVAASLWQDTARTSAVTTDGQTIKGVTDLSGVGNHLSEATNPPTYKTGASGINSLSVALADGTNDQLRSGNITQAQPFTMIAVAKHTTGATAQKFLFGQQGGVVQILEDSSGNWSMYAGSVVGNSVDVDANAHIVVGVFNAASSKLYLDGGTSGTLSAGTSAFSAKYISLFTDTVRFWPGPIGEALMYSGALSLTDINSLGSYLGTKWGITWTTAT